MKSESVSLLSEPLPFRLFRLSPEQRAHVDRRLIQWCEQHPFGDERFRNVVAVYLELCSPENPDPAALELVTDFLAWIFLLNDLPPGEERVRSLAAARRTLAGEKPSGDLAAIATANLLKQIKRQLEGRDCSRLDRRLSMLLEAFHWEAMQFGAAVPPPLDVFRAYRKHTIADPAYLEIWRVAEGLAMLDRHWVILSELEDINARIIYLTNDIHSAVRDARLGKLNTLFCLMNDQGVDLDEAKKRLYAELQSLVAGCGALVDALSFNGPEDSSVSRYVQFLGSNLEGNRQALHVLTRRYQGLE